MYTFQFKRFTKIYFRWMIIVISLYEFHYTNMRTYICMYLCMYIHKYTYMYIYIHTYIYIYIYIYSYMYMYIYMYKNVGQESADKFARKLGLKRCVIVKPDTSMKVQP
jgi:hypothetical protein